MAGTRSRRTFAAPSGSCAAAVRCSLRWPSCRERRGVVEGWVEHPGGRHHGAHAAAAARSLVVAEGDLLDFSQNINPLGIPSGAMEAAQRALREEADRYPDAGYRELREALAAYLAVAPARILPTNGGAVLVVDEAFADFAPEVSVAPQASENTYVARSFTKFFGIPGLRLGCLVCADPGRIQQFQPSWPVNAVASAAAAAAVGDPNFVRSSVAGVLRLRARLLEDLEALPGLTAFPSAANFLLVHGPEGLSRRLARRGILVRGCEPFLGLGPGYFRVAVRV